MAKILFISVNDVNAGGIRSMFANLKQNGHQSYIIFLKRTGFPYSVGKEYLYASEKVKEYDSVGINEKGEAFRYSRGPEVTTTEKNYSSP